MTRFIKKHFPFLALALFFVFLIQAEATVVMSPKNPKARSDVTLTLSSYSYDVNTAMISWKVNGQVALSGQGEKSLKIRTGDIGSSQKVIVTAQAGDGAGSEETIVVAPSSITLLYEAPRSYVPLLYEGRSLPSTGGVVRVTALPLLSDGGALISPSKLSYTWYLDDQVLKNSSGLGKQAANIRLDFLKSSQVVKVVVRSSGGTESQESVTVYPHDVMPLLYSYDPIFGPLLTSVFGKRIETTSEFTVALEPYYVSINDEREPTYEWFLGGLPSTPLDGRVLGFQPKANNYGSKMLTIKVSGGLRGIQSGEAKTEIIFDTRK